MSAAPARSEGRSENRTGKVSSYLVGMAGFHNVLVHLYLEVDPHKVYSYLQHDLGDFELFAQYIAEYLATMEAGQD